jgi:membrane protein YqaA with SNARE-associated domain
MTFFRKLYLKVVNLSKHQHAPYYLAGVSFVESSFFPIPPDVMLIPMIIAKPLKAWQYAVITTIGSIVGGLLGYVIGYYFFELLGEPFIALLGYQSAYLKVIAWFNNYGFYALLIAGFTPIPYKLFTIAGGAAQMLLFPFIVASIIGRGLRFFLVAGLLRYFGVKFERVVLKYIDIIAWSALLLIAVLCVTFWIIKT